ncbi:hypothetical protein QL285_090410 [Trifolium repens]|nr:hypothetical protein QL285_090410 [Trifolium repens]
MHFFLIILVVAQEAMVHIEACEISCLLFPGECKKFYDNECRGVLLHVIAAGCLLCDSTVENSASKVWYDIINWLKSELILTSDIFTLLVYVTFLLNWMETLWVLWHRRNQGIFEGRLGGYKEIVEKRKSKYYRGNGF